MLNTEKEKTEQTTFILFELAETIYGIQSQIVQQMEMVERITPVPNTPPFVEGLVFSRGQVIPAINLRLRFGFEKIHYDTRSRLIVINAGSRTVGLIADTAREFVTIPSNNIMPPPEGITGLTGKYLAGVAKLNERLILILNPEELINVTETISPSIKIS